MNNLTGEYQNNVEQLSALDIKSYERIFKIFKSSVDNKEFYTFNTLKSITFPEIDGSYIDYYTVKTKTPMTILSYEIYGDIKSWWILYLLNKELFTGAPFYVSGGNKIRYVKDYVRTLIYADITQSTVFGGRHF